MTAASIECIAEGCVATVLARQPQGAIALGGYSLGAVVAFEMARQIKAVGRDIAVLAIIDQPAPGRMLSARKVLPALMRWTSDLPAYLTDQSFRDDVRAWRRAARRRAANVGRAVLGRPLAPPPARFPHFTPQEMRLTEAQKAALRRHRPCRCERPVAVFRASVTSRRLAADATLGWRDVAGRVVAIERVPGNHHSVTTEPHVRALARSLRRVLDKAQA
jgi:thioesterase domain-containing protein